MNSVMERVRDYVDKHPDATNSEVAKALKMHHMSVHWARPKKRGRKPGRKAANGNGMLTFEELLAAKKEVARLGGLERAKEAIGQYERLVTA